MEGQDGRKRSGRQGGGQDRGTLSEDGHERQVQARGRSRERVEFWWQWGTKRGGSCGTQRKRMQIHWRGVRMAKGSERGGAEYIAEGN